jgi:hypothetical protein
MFNHFCIENLAVCAIMWKNVVEPDRPQMVIQRIRFACWITKATKTHSGQLLHISFPLPQWLGERALILSYT